MRRKTCSCCGGTGKVDDMFGRLRPCSRCDLEGYERHQRVRYGQAPDPRRRPDAPEPPETA